jgi:ABC-type sulfate transport system substrate-binding protein
VYGSQLKKSEAAGKADPVAGTSLLRRVWANVISTPGSAREARTQFETGYGDALITYEMEGLEMKQAGAAVEVVVPKATIFSEHPAVAVDKNVSEATRPLVQAFMQYLWSEEAQRAFVKHHFRAITDERLNQDHPGFAQIALPFTVDYFGGWARAYPEIIETVWQEQARTKR